MTEILIVDSTLRDGSHAKRHKFTEAEVQDYAAAAEAAGIKLLVIGHGNGLGASSLQIGKSLLSDNHLLSVAKKELRKTRLGVFIIPGFGTVIDDLEPAISIGAEVVFVACHCSEADVTQKHIEYVKNKGKTAYGFLMMSHMLSPQELLEQAIKMQGYGADGVVLVDSAGAYLPKEVEEKVSHLARNLKINIGFHAHNNLGMAVANSLSAVSAGATIIDTTSRGFGAGAGNCPLEVFAAVLDRIGIGTGMNLYKLMDISDNVVSKFMEKSPGINGVTLTSGIAGVFSGFCPIAIKTGARFGVDPRDILMELGKRKIIAGQEDYITQIAAELSGKKSKSDR